MKNPITVAIVAFFVAFIASAGIKVILDVVVFGDVNLLHLIVFQIIISVPASFVCYITTKNARG